MSKPGSEFEGYVHYVYTSLLNLKGDRIMVGKNVYLTGKSGVDHEIDVYYEFEQVGIKHRVAIECKATKDPVAKGRIQEFWGKIHDIPNVVGVIVSESGYQSGAKDYASHYGILAITAQELPNIFELLAMRIKSIFLPDDSFIGEPFWVPMHMEAGKMTGMYCYLPKKNSQNPNLIPLFISKKDALEFEKQTYKEGTSVIRGVPQYCLKVMIEIVLAVKTGGTEDVNFVLFLPSLEVNGEWIGYFITPEDLKKRFLLSNNK